MLAVIHKSVSGNTMKVWDLVYPVFTPPAHSYESPAEIILQVPSCQHSPIPTPRSCLVFFFSSFLKDLIQVFAELRHFLRLSYFPPLLLPYSLFLD